MEYAELSLAEIAINIPLATNLFRKNRLDFCCGGKVLLKDACQKNALNLQEITQALKQLETQPQPKLDTSVYELTDFIISRYHDDLRRRIPELAILSEKVEKVHADHPSCPHGLSGLMRTIQEELFSHMQKEETVLFPLFKSGKGFLALMPVKVMTAEHDTHGRQLEEVRRQTSNFSCPPEACPTWKALYKGLEKLEEELMEHIHLENNVLFPQALK
jgi:regulator of cell morphogenesis and NO signaling